MKKFVLSCILVILIFAVPIKIAVSHDPDVIKGERRRRADFPAPPEKITTSVMREYFRKLGLFWSDHFPLREAFLMAPVVLKAFQNDNLDMEECYRGKEDWLFLGNSGGRGVDKLQGALVLDGPELKKRVRRYTVLRDIAAEHGLDFIILIGPNKSSVYPEYLPSVVVPAKKRYITPLLEGLKKDGVKTYDPTERLRDSKNRGLLYHRTDTHWNLLGAYVAYEGLSKVAPLPAMPPFTFTPVPPMRGDLVDIGAYTEFPNIGGDNFEIDLGKDLELDGGQPTEENPMKSLRLTNPHNPQGKTLWVFGDSFSIALRPYLGTAFKEVRIFGHMRPEAFREILNDTSGRFGEKPEFILWESVERNF